MTGERARELYLGRDLVTLLVVVVLALGAGHLPHHLPAGVVRHGDAHGDVHVLQHLHRLLLAHLLPHHLAPWGRPGVALTS